MPNIACHSTPFLSMAAETADLLDLSGEAAKCRHHAAHCRALAAACKPDLRVHFLAAADVWEFLGARYERLEGRGN
jgi:hypothetical protein